MRHVVNVGASVLVLSVLAVGCQEMKWGGRSADDAAPAGKAEPAGKAQPAGKPEPAVKADPSLFERLGGQAAIDAVCEDFVARAAGNPAVNFFRKDVPGYPEWKPTPDELAEFNKLLKQFVAQAAGGPVKYEGRSMKEAHAGMKITGAEFDALAADLSASLDKFKVPEREKAELLAAVAATRKDIVELE